MLCICNQIIYKYQTKLLQSMPIRVFNQSFLEAEGAETEEARAGLAAEAGTARVAGVGRAHRPLAEVSGEAGRAVAVPMAVFVLSKMSLRL